MILFCINKLGVGGAERVFIKDANALSKMGYDIFFCILFGEKSDQSLFSDLEIKYENIFFANAKNFYDISALSRVSDFIRSKKVKTVYSTLNEANIFCRLLKLWNLKLNIITREANVAGPKPIKFKFLDLLLNLFVKIIVCVSEEVRISLLKYQPFYKIKMQVLPNGVEVPEVQRNYSQINLPIKILNVGSLTIKKGHRYLIEALSLVQKENPNSFILDIVGDGAERENLEKLAKEMSLENKITFFGQLASEQVKEKYISSDIFILPSLWEGSPNVLLEAMSYGLVCISARVSGAVGMIEEGVSGFLVPKGNSEALAKQILAVMNNKQNSKIIGQNARRRIEQIFAYAIYIKKLRGILNL